MDHCCEHDYCGWQQTIKDWTIRRKILTGFSGVLLLAAVLGLLALWSLLDEAERPLLGGR